MADRAEHNVAPSFFVVSTRPPAGGADTNRGDHLTIKHLEPSGGTPGPGRLRGAHQLWPGVRYVYSIGVSYN